MTPEELLRAIGQVDGELVQEAEEYRPLPGEGRPPAGGRRWAGWPPPVWWRRCSPTCPLWGTSPAGAPRGT